VVVVCFLVVLFFFFMCVFWFYVFNCGSVSGFVEYLGFLFWGFSDVLCIEWCVWVYFCFDCLF